MSDFEDEEGVDEPVLDDENEEEGTEEEEVVLSQNISSYFLCLLYFQLAKMSVGQDNFTPVELESIFKPSYILARSWSAFLVTQKPPENPLTEEMLADSLSLMCKTGDGLAHAYVRLDVHEK